MIQLRLALMGKTFICGATFAIATSMRLPSTAVPATDASLISTTTALGLIIASEE